MVTEIGLFAHPRRLSEVMAYFDEKTAPIAAATPRTQLHVATHTIHLYCFFSAFRPKVLK
jgi:hypothetical protein